MSKTKRRTITAAEKRRRNKERERRGFKKGYKSITTFWK